MNPEWGGRWTDYVTKAEGTCCKCRLSCQNKNDVHCYYGYICAAELKAVILDELERLGEHEKPKEAMRL